MKKNLIKVFVISFIVFAFSCQQDEKYAPKKPSDGIILFSVDPKALTGGSLVGVVQPSLDVISARFSKATVASPNYFGGNAVITLALPQDMTNVSVNLVVTSTGARELKGTIANGVWSAPLSTLGAGGTTPANNASIVLEFIASNADGSRKTARFFSVTVLA
ncbi:MAG: hypothetical protein HYZ44_01125 [Bacteroidetes bacterium]|nr:hypothetical protein [Bacteroidota bacterium]